jgi:hypothetical protein
MTYDPRTETSRPPVVGVFSDRTEAERAFDHMTKRGYTPNDAHLMMSEDTRSKYWPDKDKTHTKALEGTATGGANGAAVGGAAAAIAAIGTTLAIPGLGLLVAGPLAAGLAGAGAGALSGGLVGALVGAGIPEDKAKQYDEEVKKGKVVVGINPRTDEDAEYFQREWSRP